MTMKMSKPELVAIAYQNLEICAAGYYTVEDLDKVVMLDHALDRCETGTVLYTPAMLRFALEMPYEGTEEAVKVTVTKETTQAALRRLAARGPVCGLNFASAKNPGGGWLRGTVAQEEDLARASALYQSLITKPTYYEANREADNPLYTDHLIYSPEVPFFRDASYKLLEAPFYASIITMPAPNAGALFAKGLGNQEDLADAVRRRIAMILKIAYVKRHRRLVLGAWGCGVFKNDAYLVARTFREKLDLYAGMFDEVVFAIHDTSAEQETLQAFVSILGGRF